MAYLENNRRESFTSNSSDGTTHTMEEDISRAAEVELAKHEQAKAEEKAKHELEKEQALLRQRIDMNKVEAEIESPEKVDAE